MIRIAQTVITFCLLVGLNSACLDDPDCYALNNNIVGITFKDFVTSASKSIEDVAVLSDTILLVDTASTSSLIIPINYFLQTTTYTIPAKDTVYQMTLGYKSQSQYVSQDCGARFVVSDLSIISHNFDSVRLVSTTPGDDEQSRNIEIFWR